MAKKYIKTHSNYVLSTKHQYTNDGTIYERDITTIGGRDQFAKGQVPIYRSGNFVITINNDNSVYRKVAENDWHRNDEGEIWTLDTLKHYEKDEPSSYDKKIVVKKDYLDLRDYAYYGSCAELMRVSVDDILRTYPGELFVPYEILYVSKTDGSVQYTEEAAIAAFGENGYDVVKRGIKGTYTSFDDGVNGTTKEELELGMPYSRMFNYKGKSLSLIDNPFGINIHDNFIPDGANPLKYFADGGIDNYVGYLKLNNNDEVDIEGTWKFDSRHEYSLKVVNTNWEKKDCFQAGDCLGTITLCFSQIDYSFKTTPGLQRDSKTGKVVESQDCCDDSLSIGGTVQVESYSTSDCKYSVTIYVFKGDNNEIKYLVEDLDKGGKIIFNDDNCITDSAEAITDFSGDFKWENFVFRIRPRKEVIDEYFDNLELFEKVLLNRDSDPIYTASFELISDDDYGMHTYTKQFTFPTTYGGYNLGSNGQQFTNYVNSLSDVGEYYDSLFTDNLWRSMTHESIKNFDWTYTRRYEPGEEEPFVEGGTKIQKVIRLFGREFDEVKTYIDAIDDLNTVTYDDVNNIPDYFFTDKLEEEGWDVRLVHPLELSEFVNGHDNVPVDVHGLFKYKYDKDGNEIDTEQAEKLNYFYDSDDEKTRNKITIQRVFNQKTATVVPYSCSKVSNPEGVINACGSLIKTYCDENKYSSSDVSNEFLKRLIINSSDIWRHKGTIEGIEMLLSLFGLRSKNRVYSDEKYFITKKGVDGGDEIKTFNASIKNFNSCPPKNSIKFELTADKTNCLSLTSKGGKYYNNYKDKLYNLYDYDIKEYTLFTTREEDEWLENKNMYKFDWVNSTKLVTYGNGNYQAYQGLPVSYKNVEETVAVEGEGEEEEATEETIKKRYLYPHFNTFDMYDGNPYYQMDGGWMQKRPFMFDAKNNIVAEPEKKESEGEENTNESSENENRRNSMLFTETVKNIKCVKTLQELLSNPSLVDNSGDICQVLDLSGRYAVIDGYVYPLLTEVADDGSSGYSFFYVTVQNNSLLIGNALFTDYVIISNPYFSNNRQRINLLDDYYNDREIKVYILEKEEEEETDPGENEGGDSNEGENTEEEKEPKKVYDIDAFSKDVSISTFTVFEDGKYMEGDNYTNYFIINNIDYYNELSVLGWQQLKDDEFEYYRMNSLTDYREGNNPHTGHMRYDNGHKYLTYFQKIFKHVSENDLIDYRQYDEGDIQYLEDLDTFGFKNLIDEDECEKNYDKYLREDNKCHFFGAIASHANDEGNDDRLGLSCLGKRELASSDNVDSYGITDIFRKDLIMDDEGEPKILNLKYGKVYENIGEEGEYDEEKIDEVTDQIVNVKRMEIEFFIKNGKEYSKEWLEEVKYIDSVIMPYLTQMIPSSTIWRVKYTTRDKEEWPSVDECLYSHFETNKDKITCDDGETVTISLTAEKNNNKN